MMQETTIIIISAQIIPKRSLIHLVSLMSLLICLSSIATVFDAGGSFCECMGGIAPDGRRCVLAAAFEDVIAMVLLFCAPNCSLLGLNEPECEVFFLKYV